MLFHVILYGVLSPIESLWSPKTEFVSPEVFKNRVTYPSIRNFKLSSKKDTLWCLRPNRKQLEPKNRIYKSCDLSIDQKFYAELKKVYFMKCNRES
jgi:hypothetical protein